jgi:phospho-N-acetylmuramoyl-pentapeptide-transferase
MLYHLSFYLKDFFFGFNVFKYITFRSFLAILLAFFLTLLLTPIFLKKLKALQRLLRVMCGNTPRRDTPSKNWFPTWAD